MPSWLDLPPLGTCAYGGFTFSAAAETVGFSVTPQWDQAQRTVVFSTYRISIQDYLHGNPSDPLVQATISQLTAPAYGLSFSGRALSPILVNAILGKVRDAKWGQKPSRCEMSSHGHNVTKII